MIMTHAESEQERIDFAKKAARHFAGDASMWTYTDGDIKPGALFAMRYGLGNDCVVVFRIGYDAPVVNYQELVRTVE